MQTEPVIDTTAVRQAYRRWAPIYDSTFGRVAEAGRRHAVHIINNRQGSVLEVGVGTGLSLQRYESHLEITGIDLSTDMLNKAETRVEELGLSNVLGLHEMDASALEFGDATFDTVVAMYVLTTVPQPERVMAELERVCKHDGEVILVNHFSQDDGFKGWAEQRMAPLARELGWRPVFPVERVMGFGNLRLAERRALKPFGLFTMLRFVKQPELTDARIGSDSQATNPALRPATAEALYRDGEANGAA